MKEQRRLSSARGAILVSPTDNQSEYLSFVYHLHSTHRHIQRLLASLRSHIMSAGAYSCAFQSVKWQLNELKQRIVRHYSEELGRHDIAQAAQHCPELSAAARDLHEQFLQSLGSIEQMQALFEGRSVLGSQQVVAERALAKFAADLGEMEVEELRLIRAIFTSQN